MSGEMESYEQRRARERAEREAAHREQIARGTARAQRVMLERARGRLRPLHEWAAALEQCEGEWRRKHEAASADLEAASNFDQKCKAKEKLALVEDGLAAIVRGPKQVGLAGLVDVPVALEERLRDLGIRELGGGYTGRSVFSGRGGLRRTRARIAKLEEEIAKLEAG